MTVTNEEILLALRDVATSLTAKIDAVATVQVEHGKAITQLQSDMETVKSDLETVKSDLETVKSDMETVKSDMETVKSDMETVKSDMETVKSDISEVKHTVGVNHLKLSGKIEMVASMLADHMVDHHEPAGRRRA